MNEEITVLVADDHEFEVKGIIDLLSYAEGIRVVGRAFSPQQAVNEVLKTKPDVILLDLMYYRTSDESLTAIRQIKEMAPTTSILAMSAYDELLEDAKKAGADIARHKDFLGNKPELVGRIRDAYELGRLPKPEPSLVEDLTERELVVLECLSRGLVNKDIAEELCIAISTVKRHVSNILGKLDVKSRGEAGSYARDHNFFSK